MLNMRLGGPLSHAQVQRLQKSSPWTRSCRPRTHRRAVAEDGASSSAFDIVFGKPAAPKELYEKIAKDSRAALMAQVQSGDQSDLVLAALHLCAEDDAIKTKTHIPLPVDSFSTRLDNMVAECRVLMSESSPMGAQQELDFACSFLFSRWGLKIASGMSDGAYSPYRVYMNNVLTQRCGTPSSSASLLSAFLLRLRSSGALPSLTSEPSIGIPAEPGANPIAVVAGTESSHGPLIRWVTKLELLVEMMDELKRFYWSWEWPLGASSGFYACASALVGETGRSGTVNAAVGVIQPKGRPFGDVTLSVLAAERAALVSRVYSSGWLNAIQVRDLGALYLHIGKTVEGLALLDSYQAWLAGKGALLVDSSGPGQAGAGPLLDVRPGDADLSDHPGAFSKLLTEVLSVQRRKVLEGAMGQPSAPIEIKNLDDE